MKYYVDRIEDGIAVIQDENSALREIPKESLPADAKEGSVIFVSEEGVFTDDSATAQRRKQMFEKMRKLKEKNSGRH